MFSSATLNTYLLYRLCRNFFRKKIVSLLIATCLTTTAFAQPANDDPCSAIPLAIAPTCSYSTYTTASATATTGVPDPGCASYQGGDVWFSVVVPCTGVINIDTRQGIITDGGMAIYSGDCAGLTLIDCDDDGSSNGLMPSITASNLTAGSTIFIRVWEYGNNNPGSFDICVSEPPPAGPGGTCNAPLPFCTSNTYTFPNSTNVPSLGGGGIYGCLGSTPNPVWYFMQIQNGGPLSITISQTNTSGQGIDVDFVLWGPFTSMTGSCAAISSSNIVDCSYSIAPVEIADIPNATPGEFYILLMTNYDGDPGTITFQQTGGTATSSCAVICNVTAGNTGPVCTNGTFDLTSSIPGGTYNWTGPNCFSSTLQNPTGITAPSTPGSYTYTVSVTTSTGGICTASTTVVVGSLGGTATPVNTSCPGAANGSITVNPNPSTGSYTYTLNPGNIVQVNNPTFTGLAAGTYSVTYSNGAGCTGVLSNITIGTGSGVTATYTAVATSCPTASNGTATVTPTSGNAPYQFSLDGGPLQSSNQFNNLTAGNHVVTIQDASGCTGTVNITVTAGTNISSTLQNTNPVCANINDGVIIVSPTSGSAPYQYSINGGALQPGNTFSNLAPGSYTINIVDAIGCTGTNNATLTTNPAILFSNATVTNALCNTAANGTITVAASGGVAPYQYALSPFTTFQSGGSFTGLAAGSYTVRIRDNVGCIKDTILQVTEPTTLTSSASEQNAAGCSNNDGSISTVSAGGTGPYSYTIAGPTVNTSGAGSGIFTGLAGGNYTVTVTDANGCSTTANAVVSLIDNMFLTLGADTTICVGSSVTFNPQTNPETSIFTWSGINGTPTSTIANPAIKNAVATPVDTATYVLHAQWGGCERRDTITVNVLHKPVPYAGEDTAICHMSYATLMGSASNLSGPVSYEWTPPTGITDPTQPITTVYPAGSDTTYTFNLIVRDEYGCNFSVTDEVRVRVQPPVPAYAGNDTTAVMNAPHQLLATGGTSYLWTPAATLNNPAIANPLATLGADQKFIVQVTDVAGCIGYDTVFVKAYSGPAYYIPNAFTPNGDGLNDVFRPIPVGMVKTEWFRVFNRYGEQVFETTQWMKGWDGSFRGKTQAIGAYTWIIKGTDRNGKIIQMKGTVMLLQ